jgi:hypothetical protein
LGLPLLSTPKLALLLLLLFEGEGDRSSSSFSSSSFESKGPFGVGSRMVVVDDVKADFARVGEGAMVLNLADEILLAAEDVHSEGCHEASV